MTRKALAALAVLAAGGGAALLWSLRARSEVRRHPGLSVLLVTVDTLRADALGCYGHPTVTTPWIDRLAAAGVRFEDAHAQNVITLPSHANILSGRYPLDHGVRDNAGYRFPAGDETLATLLGARGYATGAFVSAFPLDSRFGLDRGFDVYDDRFGDVYGNTAFHMQERRGPDTVAAARRWIEEQGDRPYLAWVHVYEPHFPYEPPEAFASPLDGERYYGEVSAADAALAPLLEPLLTAAGRGRTLVVLTADHGESLGEHGEMTHGIFAYEATLRVPLVLYQPALFRPRVVSEPARHVDILPTILDALSLPAPNGLPGRSLLGVAAGQRPSAPLNYFESLSAAMNRGWAPIHGVMRGRMKYVDLPIPELYDLAADPHETRNLVASEPQALEELRTLLSELRRGDKGPRRTGESAETRERLKALGYVTSPAASVKAKYTEDDDPKRLIALDKALQDVVSLYQAGDVQGAIALCEDVVRRRPMPLSLVNLAFLRRETGDLRGAVDAAKQALGMNPDDAEVAALLGAYLNESGRAKETVALLEPFARRADPDLDLLMALGAAFGQAGRPKDALATFGKAREIDPSNGMALVNVGTVHLMARDHAKAREALEAALVLDPSISRAHNALGVIAAETGRPDAAIQSWKRAVELNPREFDTLFNVGSLLIRQGRTTEARPYLERFAREAPVALYARDIARVRSWLRAGTGL